MKISLFALANCLELLLIACPAEKREAQKNQSGIKMQNKAISHNHRVS